MKSIKKLKTAGKAVAGSALLVGATLTGAAGFAAAQDSGSMDLGDYPSPFVDEDGNVASTIVVGDSAKTIDVVGAVNIAGSLSQEAFTTEQVSAGGADAGSWGATNGVTLDSTNDNIFFGENIDTVRSTLTEDDLSVLQSQEVLTGDSEQEVEQYIYVGDEAVNYGTPDDTSGDEDPFIHVETVGDNGVDSSNYLYRLQANFQDGVQFEESGETERNDDVYGEEITLFGMDFTVADDSFTGDDQLVLYGSQEEVDVQNGEEETVEVGGNEHTVETVAVTGSNAAAVRIDGTLEQVEEDDEFEVSDETLRVDNIIDTGDNGAGVVQFAIGSEKVVLENGQPVMLGSDEEDVDGTHVTLSGSGISSSHSAADGDDDEIELSSVEIAVGTDDSDNSHIRAGESFTDPVFSDVEVHFGGLNPDAAEDGEEIGVSADGDNDATVSFTTKGGDSATLNFAHDENVDNTGDDAVLRDSDNNEYISQEGDAIAEDEYTVVESGDFARLLQVTEIETDGHQDGTEDNEEVTVTLEDAVTGADFEVTLEEADATDDDDVDATGDFNTEDKVIDGQSYTFTVETISSNAVTEISIADNEGDGTDLFNGLETENGATVHLVENEATGDSYATTGDGDTNTFQYELPTGSLWIRVTDPDVDNAGDSTEQYSLDEGSNWNSLETADAGDIDEINVGGVVYSVETTTSGDTAGAAGELAVNNIGLDPDQDATNDNDDVEASPGVLVVEEEGEDDTTASHFVSASTDEDDDRVEIGGAASGTFDDDAPVYATTTGVSLQSHEDDDDLSSDYSTYGTYVEEDSDEEGAYSFMYPAAQSTAGVAVTGQDGSISAEGGAGSVDSQVPAGWPDSAALDSDGNIDSVKTSQNTILVGGPAVNALTDELAQDNMTMTGSEYQEGDQLIQLVEDSFADDVSSLVVAGYSGEDTRAAANYIANYADHADELAGNDQVNLRTMQTTQ